MKEIKYYEAFDGKRFDNAYDCSRYEKRCEQEKFENSDEYKRKKEDFKRLNEMVIVFSGIPINEHYLDPDCWYFTWFKVDNNEDAELLDEYVDNGISISDIKKYPTYICVESEREFFYDEEELDFGGEYAITLDECIKETEWFFDKFGYNAQITERSK